MAALKGDGKSDDERDDYVEDINGEDDLIVKVEGDRSLLIPSYREIDIIMRKNVRLEEIKEAEGGEIKLRKRGRFCRHERREIGFLIMQCSLSLQIIEHAPLTELPSNIVQNNLRTGGDLTLILMLGYTYQRTQYHVT